MRSSYGGGTTRSFGLFNLTPPPGYSSRFGFSAFGEPIDPTHMIAGDHRARSLRR